MQMLIWKLGLLLNDWIYSSVAVWVLLLNIAEKISIYEGMRGTHTMQLENNTSKLGFIFLHEYLEFGSNLVSFSWC